MSQTDFRKVYSPSAWALLQAVQGVSTQHVVSCVQFLVFSLMVTVYSCSNFEQTSQGQSLWYYCQYWCWQQVCDRNCFVASFHLGAFARCSRNWVSLGSLSACNQSQLPCLCSIALQHPSLCIVLSELYLRICLPDLAVSFPLLNSPLLFEQYVAALSYGRPMPHRQTWQLVLCENSGGSTPIADDNRLVRYKPLPG